MTDPRIEKARALLAGITPGPWQVHKDNAGFVSIIGRQEPVVWTTGQPGEGANIFDRDAEFIAAAPTIVSDLLAVIAERDAEVERLTRPCDGGCSYGDGPAEECSAHGRPVAEVWEIVNRFAAERDEARAEVEEWRETAMDARAVADDYRDHAAAMQRERDDWKARWKATTETADEWAAERDEARAAIERVEKLADEWLTEPCVAGYRIPNDNDDDSQCLHCAADTELRTALVLYRPDEEEQ